MNTSDTAYNLLSTCYFMSSPVDSYSLNLGAFNSISSIWDRTGILWVLSKCDLKQRYLSSFVNVLGVLQEILYSVGKTCLIETSAYGLLRV